MDHEVDSAVAAMKAMQEQIQRVESENSTLKRDIAALRLSIASASNSQIDNEMEDEQKFENLSQQLHAASDILQDLRIARNEKAELQNTYSQIEKELGNQLRKNTLLKQRTEYYMNKLNEISDTEDIFDSILLSYTLPPPPDEGIGPEIRFNRNNISKKPTTEGGRFQVLLAELRTLPTTLKGEKLDEKRRCLEILRNAKKKITKLELEAKSLSTKSTRLVEAEQKKAKARILSKAADRMRNATIR